MALNHVGSQPLIRRRCGWGGAAGIHPAWCAVCFLRMVLCIATDDSHSLSRLSLKFGAPLKSCRHLLENAKKSHVEVVGVRCALGAPTIPTCARLSLSQELIILHETFPKISEQSLLLHLEFCLLRISSFLERRFINVSFLSLTVSEGLVLRVSSQGPGLEGDLPVCRPRVVHSHT